MYETKIINGRSVKVEKTEKKGVQAVLNSLGKTPNRGVMRREIIKFFKDKNVLVNRGVSNKELAKIIRDYSGKYKKSKERLTIKYFYYSYICHEDLKPFINIPISRKKKKKKDFVQTDDFLQSYEWRRTRVHALRNNDGRCELCGRSKKDGIQLHVDHIKPRKKYPESALDVNNLQVLCNECNHGKGNWDETDWRKPKHERDIVFYNGEPHEI